MDVLFNFDCLILYVARSIAGIAGSNAEGDISVCLSVVSIVCCQVEVSASG